MSTQVEMSLRDSLKLFSSNLIQQKRGEKFIRVLKEDCPNRSEYQELIRSLHMEELPNDWRYETIYEITLCLLDYFGDEEELTFDNCTEALYEISDNLADYSNSDLFQWLSDNPSRASFDNDYEIINSIDSTVDLGYIARARQVEEINIMGSNLIYHFTEK